MLRRAFPGSSLHRFQEVHRDPRVIDDRRVTPPDTCGAENLARHVIPAVHATTCGPKIDRRRSRLQTHEQAIGDVDVNHLHT